MTKFDKSILKDLLPPNPVILDIGCYDGKDGLEMLDLIPGALVHCFDPVSKDVFKGHGRVGFYPLAVGSDDGLAWFHPSTHVQSGSLKRPKSHTQIWPEIDFKKPTLITCVKLDTFLSLTGGVIDFIWCDLNGSEGDFIDGATETLKRTRYLYIEFSDKELYEGQINRKELEAKLPGWKVLGEYNVGENFGNLFLKNELFNG